MQNINSYFIVPWNRKPKIDRFWLVTFLKVTGCTFCHGLKHIFKMFQPQSDQNLKNKMSLQIHRVMCRVFIDNLNTTFSCNYHKKASL